MEENVKKLHKEGLSNRQIAISCKTDHYQINKIIKGLGLRPNGSVRNKKLVVVDGFANCNQCGINQPIENYKELRSNRPYPYRLTYCKKCLLKKHTKYLNSTPHAYWQRRFYGWKKKAAERGLDFNLDLDYLKNLYSIQQGKCVYTKEPLELKIGKGLIDQCLSLDRFDNDLGYIKGNVVFCTKQFNSVKINLSLEKFRMFMPVIYNRGLSLHKKLSTV